MMNLSEATKATYDTVYRLGPYVFTGVPIARLHKGVWYWPDYQTARNFAMHYELPTDRIISYQKGWAIQMRKGGSYVAAPGAEHTS